MNNLTKSKAVKFATGFVGVAVALTFAITPMIAGATTASDLQTTINSLMTQIQAAQAQLSALNGGSSTTTTGTSYTFNTNLTVGSKGTDVLNLQKVLNGSADTQVALTGAGSVGNETTYFGILTQQAVSKFQVKYGISPTAGYFGPVTRAKMNTMTTNTTTTTTTTTTTYPTGCTSAVGYSSTTGQACSSGTTTVLPTGGSLTVMAGVQPMNSLAPQGAARVPFTTFTVTAGSADVTVNSVTVQRSGLAQDAVFSGVVLLDQNGLQIGIAKTLNSNHQAMVGDPFVVRAGTSMTLTVAGNIAADTSNYAGQVAGLDVVAINTTASVAGSLPITGAQQTVNHSLTIGTATIDRSSFDPNNGSNQPIGTTGYRFSGIRVTAGSAEDVTFKSVRWNQTGSVGSGDLANVVTIVNGTSYPTTVSADGKYYSTVFPSGIVIAKGNSVDVYIQGDVVGSSASGRTAEFDIYKNTDLYLVGNTYGYGVTAPVGANGLATVTNSTHGSMANTGVNPWFEGSLLNITAGSVTLIGKANEVGSQNIAINVANQPLGGFATNFSGEPVSVQQMIFTVSTTTGNTFGLTSVTLVDPNGAVVAGPVDQVGTTLTFNDTVTFPIGRAVYTLKGKLSSGTPNGTTFTISTIPGGSGAQWSNVTGQTTGNSVSLTGAGTFTMNQMTVKGAQLSVNISAQPTSQSIVAGVQNFVVANYTLDASQSGEDVRLSSFPVKFGTVPSAGNLTGCQLYNGTTALNTGSRVQNTITAATIPFSFDNSLVVPKGTVLTLSLQCNVSSPATGSIQVTADQTPADYSVTGQISGNAVNGTNLFAGGSAGGTMGLTNGSLAISVDPSSPSYTVVSGGTTGVPVAVIKLRASNEAMNLTKLGLNLYSGTASDIITAYLYNGSTLLGTMQFNQGASSATSTLNSVLALPKDTDVLITVKADFASIGTGQSGTEGTLVQVDPLNAEANGQSSGSTLGASQTASHVAGVRVFRSYPTLALDTMSTSGLSDNTLMKFKVTANSAGSVGLTQVNFQVSTSTSPAVNLLNVILYAYTDSSYSSPVSSLTNGQFGSTLCQSAGACSPKLVFTQNPPLQVGAGQTVYFKLYASVTGGSASGAGITTVLLGDSVYSGINTAAYVASSTNNFIWAGNKTTTSAVGDVDWSNGFGLSGFPASGLVQTRSN